MVVFQHSQKAISPSDTAEDFAKYLMIGSKSADILSDPLQTLSRIIKLKYLMIFSKCLMISSKSSGGNHQTLSDDPRNLFMKTGRLRQYICAILLTKTGEMLQNL